MFSNRKSLLATIFLTTILLFVDTTLTAASAEKVVYSLKGDALCGTTLYGGASDNGTLYGIVRNPRPEPWLARAVNDGFLGMEVLSLR